MGDDDDDDMDIDALLAEIPDDCNGGWLAEIPDACNMDDLLWLDLPPDEQSAGHIWADPQSAGDSSHSSSTSTMAGLRQAVQCPAGLAGARAATPTGVGVEEQQHEPMPNAHSWTGTTIPGLTVSVIQPEPEPEPDTHPIPIGNAAGTDMAELPLPPPWNPLSPWNRNPLSGFILREINAVLNPTAAVKDTPLVDNAGLAMPEPEPDPNSTGAPRRGGSSFHSTSTTADMGNSSSPDLEPPVIGASCKRKRLVCRRSTPPKSKSNPSNLLELEPESSEDGDPASADIKPDPSSADLRPPADSNDFGIINFLRLEEISMAQGDQVNLGLGEQDRIAPKAVRSYVTTVEMVPDHKTHHGCWKEKQVKPLRYDDDSIPVWRGLKRTFQFHRYDGTTTNWFMHEYISTDVFGGDLFMKGLRFREVYEEVYEGAEVPVEGEPTSTEERIKNKTVATKRNRMRGPENLVIKGESPAWQHFIRIYDKHPELEGSKVVYAVCCHCEVVLKAGTENGTKSLLTHCNHTCPVKNKKQQPSSSSSNSTGHTSCLSTAADTGSSSLDQNFNAGAGLPQSGGGGGLAETPVQASCKRKNLAHGSSSQRPKPPEFINLVETEAGHIQSDPSSTDIKPPTGSTDIEIIRVLKREESFMPHGKEVNLSLGEHDQMAPKAVRSYITTVKMMPDQNPHDLGYWKEKQVKPLRDYESDGIIWSLCRGLKRTFLYHMNDGTKTNWFMHEYVPTDPWGHDLFMKPLRFREVYYEGAEVPDGKIKNKIAAAKKHRMRGPENMVIKGESRAWQHFIKIYDSHPELEGSKVVYAVCCHCGGVLKAGTYNGTKSLLTHCDRTCRVKNKKQQPSSSSYQENLFDVLVGVGVP